MENTEKDYEEINNKVKTQVAELFNLIYGKHITTIGEMTHSNEGSIFKTDENGRVSFTKNKSGKIIRIVDLVVLIRSAIKLFNRFYEKGVSISDTWKNFKVFDAPLYDINFNHEVFKDLETDNEEMKKAISLCVSLIDTFEMYNISKTSTKTIAELKEVLDKIDIRLEKFKNEFPKLEGGVEVKNLNKKKEEETPEEKQKVSSQKMDISSNLINADVGYVEKAEKFDDFKKQIDDKFETLKGFKGDDIKKLLENLEVEDVDLIIKYYALTQLRESYTMTLDELLFETHLTKGILKRKLGSLIVEDEDTNKEEKPNEHKKFDPSLYKSKVNFLDSQLKVLFNKEVIKREIWKKTYKNFIEGLRTLYSDFMKHINSLTDEQKKSIPLLDKIKDGEDPDPVKILYSIGSIVSQLKNKQE